MHSFRALCCGLLLLYYVPLIAGNAPTPAVPATPTIASLTLSSQTFSAGPATGTTVATISITGTNNGGTTFALSGPDSAMFTVSGSNINTNTPSVTGSIAPSGSATPPILTLSSGTVYPGEYLSGGSVAAGTYVVSTGTAANTYIVSPSQTVSSQSITVTVGDGIYHYYVTPTLSGARGSAVAYPEEVAATITCNQSVTLGATASTNNTNLSNAITSISTGQTLCLAGTGPISSTWTISKAIRVTGILSGSLSNANWDNALAAIQVSGNIQGIDVTVGGVRFDHINGSATLNKGTDQGSCTPGSTTAANFIKVESVTGFFFDHTQTSSFGCVLWLNGTTNPIIVYNWDTLMEYVTFFCDVCTNMFASNNLIYITATNAQSGNTNSYPYLAGSSDGATTGALIQLDTMIYNPVWECYDNHGGFDVHFFYTYCLASCVSCGGGNQAINQVVVSGLPALRRPRYNNSVLDLGNATLDSGDGLVQVASGSGQVLTCTGGDGNGCQIENNTIRGFGTNCTTSGQAMTFGAENSATVSGTQTVSGNSCSNTLQTMAAPTFTADQPTSYCAAASNCYVNGQANGVIGTIGVVFSPAMPSWVGGYRANYAGFPGTFTLGGDTTDFVVCVDGQHICQSGSGAPSGAHNITITGTLTGLSNSPQTSATITLNGA